MSRVNVLFWVQHLLGSGHLRRALAVAEALAGHGFAVTLASGGQPMPWAVPSGVELAQLPPVRSVGSDFSAIADAVGSEPLPVLLERRRAMLLELLDRLHPGVIVTEMYPFGRRAFRHELLLLLRESRRLRQRPLIVSSVRDVLVSKARVDRLLEMRDIANEWYDLVLVHGDEHMLPFSASFPYASNLDSPVLHTGFVHTAAPLRTATPTDEILISAGGGAVGQKLIECALEARGLSRLGEASWRLLAGFNVPEAMWHRLAAVARPGLTIERHRDDFPQLMANARVSVSQAGYNTIVEGLFARARMVLVPFDAPSQDEQKRRAGRLGELGWAEVLPEEDVTASALAAAIDRAAAAPRPATDGIAFNGASQSAAVIQAHLERHLRG
jgi:predicted glycosyltransferase